MKHRLRGYQQKLRMYWHLKMGRYRVRRVATRSEFEACNALLAQVRLGELKRAGTHYRGARLATHPDHEEDGLISCVDTHTGEVVGAARFTRWSLIEHTPELAPDMVIPLDTFGELADRAYLVQRMIVRRDARGTGAAFHLMRSTYELSLKQGALICVIDCESQLWRQYARLGFRRQGQVYSKGGVFLVTMVLILHDRRHLVAVGSPLVSSLDAANIKLEERAHRWWTEVGLARSRAKNVEAIGPSDIFPIPILQGMSPRGRQQFLKHATPVYVPANLLVFQRGDGANWMCTVEEGALETFVDGVKVASDGPGQVVGELAYLTRSPRTADVYAGPGGATIVTLSPRALQRVRSPADRALLWENVSRGLASRIVAKNYPVLDEPQTTIADAPADRHGSGGPKGARSAVAQARDLVRAVSGPTPQRHPAARRGATLKKGTTSSNF